MVGGVVFGFSSYNQWTVICLFCKMPFNNNNNNNGSTINSDSENVLDYQKLIFEKEDSDFA